MAAVQLHNGSPDDPSYSAYLPADNMMSSSINSTSTLGDYETQNLLAREEEQDMKAAIKQSLRQFEVERARRIAHSTESRGFDTPLIEEDNIPSNIADAPFSSSPRSATHTTAFGLPRPPSSANRRPSSRAQRSLSISERDADFPSLTTRSTVSARDFDRHRSPEAEMILQSSGYVPSHSGYASNNGRHVAFQLQPGSDISSATAATDGSAVSSRSDLGSVFDDAFLEWHEGPDHELFSKPVLKGPMPPVGTRALSGTQTPSTSSHISQTSWDRSWSGYPSRNHPQPSLGAPRESLLSGSLGRMASPVRPPSLDKASPRSSIQTDKALHSQPGHLERASPRPPSRLDRASPRSPSRLDMASPRPTLSINTPSHNGSPADKTSAWKISISQSPLRTPSSSPPEIWYPQPRTKPHRRTSASSLSPANDNHDWNYDHSRPNIVSTSLPEWGGMSQSSTPVPSEAQARRAMNHSTQTPTPEWVSQSSTPTPRTIQPQRSLLQTLKPQDSSTITTQNISARFSIAESDIGSDIGILKVSPPGTPAYSITSSLPPYSSRGWQSTTNRESLPIYDTGASDTGSNDVPIDKNEKESIPQFNPSEFEEMDSSNNLTMTAGAANHFRKHVSTSMFSDERVCPGKPWREPCASPLIYGEDDKVETLNYRHLLSANHGENHLEKILRGKCPSCSSSFCRGCSKGIDAACLVGDACSRKCSCAVFEILSAYDQHVLMVIGNSKDYRQYIDQTTSSDVFCATLKALMNYLDPTIRSKLSNRSRRTDGHKPVPYASYLIHFSLLSNVIRELLSRTSFSHWYHIIRCRKMYQELVTFLTGMVHEWGYEEFATLRVAEIQASCGLRMWMHGDGNIEFGSLQAPLRDALKPFLDRKGPFLAQAKQYRGDSELYRALVRLSEAVEP